MNPCTTRPKVAKLIAALSAAGPPTNNRINISEYDACRAVIDSRLKRSFDLLQTEGYADTINSIVRGAAESDKILCNAFGADRSLYFILIRMRVLLQELNRLDAAVIKKIDYGDVVFTTD